MPLSPQTRRAIVFSKHSGSNLFESFAAYRYRLFVEHCGWDLDVSDRKEVDQFDHDFAEYAVLLQEARIIGGFRAIPTTASYLTEVLFPDLAASGRLPKQVNKLEISRFGELNGGTGAGRMLYALMFAYARMRGAVALTATTDLVHERCLRMLGVKSSRYTAPQIIGRDKSGCPITAVAGEIPIIEQARQLALIFEPLISELEITDETAVFRPARIPA